MNIQKLNLGDFRKGKAEDVVLPAAPKNFSYFARKSDQEESEFTKSDLNKRTQESYQSGFEEGYKKGRDEVTKDALAVEQNTKSSVDIIAAQLTKFLSEYEEQKKEYMRNMTKVTMIAIHKIAQKVIRENTEDVILQALEKSSHIIAKKPEIMIRAKKIILEKIQDKVDNILKEKEFNGKITYIADEQVSDGNCIIEWGESGISINGNEALKQVEEVLSEYLKSI